MTSTTQSASKLGTSTVGSLQPRSGVRTITGEVVREGAGVRNVVAIGGRQLPDLDPFLLFAEFGGEDPEDYAGGFPDHPHRGFETLTYVLDGKLKHADSAGNEGRLGAGDVQRMKAARGLLHAEMPDQANGRLRAIQIWLNLPARHKMDAPGYQDVPAHSIPHVERGGAAVKVLVGEAFGVASPIAGGATDLLFLDLALSAGAGVDVPLRPGHAALAYVADENVAIAGEQVPRHSAVVLGDGSLLHMSAPAGGRVLLLAAEPIGEPVARHGPFVMNTPQEIQQAFADYQAGRFA